MEELLKKLATVQKVLRVGKEQNNDFGGYKFRSTEDILQAVKPILSENGLVMYMSDNVVLIGERYYVNVTVTITDGKDMLQVEAQAREELAKKGMDASQITGMASSYAHKRALGSLFLIDNTPDADKLNTEVPDDTKPPINSKKELLKEIATEARNKGINPASLKQVIQRMFNVSGSDSLTLDQVQQLRLNFEECWKEIVAEGTAKSA